MQKILSALILLATIGPAFSTEPAHVKQLPPFNDFVVVTPPSGFIHAHERGLFRRFIREYIPIGENLSEWTKILAVEALGPVFKFPHLKDYSASTVEFFQQMCSSMHAEAGPATDTDFTIKIDCTVAKGSSLVGTTKGQRELAIYRYVKTKDVLYQIHYAWHGDDEAIADENNRTAFYEEAEQALQKVVICSMLSDTPCDGLDVYFDAKNKQLLPLSGPSPCTIESLKPCYPAALLHAYPAEEYDPNKKNGLIILKLSEHDLQDLSVANTALRTIKKVLEEKSSVTLTLGAFASENATSPEERMMVGAFLNYIRAGLIMTKKADPNKLDITLYNFR